jgi:predicted HicB family RNase H-like nuclease
MWGMSNTTPVKDRTKITFRLDEKLRRRLRVTAAKRGQSMESLIVEALEKHLPDRT